MARRQRAAALRGQHLRLLPRRGRRLLPARHLATAGALRCRPLLELVAIAAAREENRIRTETVCLGVGLGDAFRLAFEEAPETIGPVDRILCDMNGERYRGNEYGFAVLRNSRPLPRRRRLRDAGRLLGRPRRGLRPALRRPCHRGGSARLFPGAAVAGLGQLRERRRAARCCSAGRGEGG